MVVRSIVQVAAGAVAGAVLVGVPAWAVAGQQDDSPSSNSNMTSMMSDPKSQEQMMGSMSKMMDDPKMREQMRSMMSDAMGGMSGEMSGHHKSGMGPGSMSGR